MLQVPGGTNKKTEIIMSSQASDSNRLFLRFQSKRETAENKFQLPFIGIFHDTSSPTIAPTIRADKSQSSSSETHSRLRLGGFHLPTVVNYSTFLTILLTMWVSYLILPKGARKYMCNAYPKRYKRSSPHRVIRVLGRYDHHFKNEGGIAFSHTESSEQSSASSMNSTYYRGNQKFIAVKRGSPVGKASIGHPSAIMTIKRSNITHSNSSDHSGVMSERDKFLRASSSDLSSIITKNNNQSSETITYTGHGIWGKPKQFVRKRIIGDGEDTQEAHGSLSKDEDISILSNGQNCIEDKNSAKKTHQAPLTSVESFSSNFYSSTGGSVSVKENEIEASPIHPDQTCGHSPPSQMVLSSTLLSFRDPGIRLFAHGTQCQPRRIWIRLDANKEQLLWRTENVAASNGIFGNDNDRVTLGQVHEIPLMQVLFVDVGKTTAALQLLDIHEDYCFSILTNGGSLDLQASNKLERDALVSCMCLILDTVYNHLPPDRSWRRINDAATSVSNSSSSIGGGKNREQNNGWQDELKAIDSQSSESMVSNNLIPYSSSSSNYASSSATGSDVFHGVDLGVSANFGEI